mmetsp:Transcript_12464/g.17894  ORF Transcript_12464/g.17894 Transcript_12464/m.17894 type:complete len:645 (+) Transcript_12464:185-2119(+)
MGKKSRSNKLKPAKWSIGDITSNNITSNLSASSFSPPSFAADLPQPAEGWARELRKLEKELQNTRYQDAEIVLSAAKVARIMRQFDVLEKILTKAENKGVVIEDQEMWAQLNDDVAALKRAKTALRSDDMKKVINDVMKGGKSVDFTIFDDSTFVGLNCLQFAALRGDVQVLEQLIKMGAALDIEALPPPSVLATHSGVVLKPKMCTALLLAVNGALTSRNVMSIVAKGGMGGMGGRFGGGDARESYEGCVECAIQLVRLGADTSVTFQFPPGGKNHPIYQSWHMWNIEGKSVRDVATLVGSELFEKTVEEFSTMEHQIEHVNCRCGSRLPWKQCHAGKPTDPYYLNGKVDKKNISKITWRYSPLAPCHCNTSNARLGLAGTKKIHFKCCWDETAHREYYQCDKTSEISVMARTPTNPMQREAMKYMQEMLKGQSEDEISKLMDSMQQMNSDPEFVIKSRCKMVREGGALAMQAIVAGDNPCSKLSSWDPEVYAGVMETMDPVLSFQWNDVHWALPKAELLKRVSEWNEALEQYCDSIGLSGSEREDVTKLHTASPFAPCGNVKCDKVETSVKQYSRCSKCYSVAYCSSACQREAGHIKEWAEPQKNADAAIIVIKLLRRVSTVILPNCEILVRIVPTSSTTYQ